jgi:hypothetical protein
MLAAGSKKRRALLGGSARHDLATASALTRARAQAEARRPALHDRIGRLAAARRQGQRPDPADPVCALKPRG